MGKVLIKEGTIVGVDKVYVGDVLIEDGIISRIERSIQEEGAPQVIHASGKYILPGFIDVHNHGSAGFDASFGTYDLGTGQFDSSERAYKNGLEKALKSYLKAGVTKVVLTSMAAPLDQLKDSFGHLKDFLQRDGYLSELVYGINLEGTFLKDPVYAGAQNPKYFFDVDEKVVNSLQVASGGSLRIVNIPPEHGEKGYKLTRKLKDLGIVVAGGHSAAYGDEYKKAIGEGLNLAVHFLNGPSRSNSKSFRSGGAVEAMLRSDRVFLEIICDGYHVDPSYVRDVIARKGFERVIMITDSMFANGMAHLEQFELFGLQGAVHKSREYLQVLGSENTLFGSVLNSNVGFSNVILWLTQEMEGTWHRTHKALPLNDALLQASAMFSSNPAKLLGIFDSGKGQKGTGSVEVGKSADLIVADLKADKLSISHNLLKGTVHETKNL